MPKNKKSPIRSRRDRLNSIMGEIRSTRKPTKKKPARKEEKLPKKGTWW